MNEPWIDWDEIHRRIAKVNQAIEDGWLPSAEERQRILKERAEILAREVEVRTSESTIEVVKFLLSSEHYGIESQYIREVYPLKEFTPLPCVPRFVLGLLNVRGRIISVIDIRKFFGMPEKGLSDLNKVIIVSNGRMEFGILADAILGVRNLAAGELGEPLPTLTGIHREFMKGVTSERLVVLDAARILADQNIVIHEEV